MSYIVTALLQTAGVFLLAVVGVAAGWWFSRRHDKSWLLGFLIPLLGVGLLLIPLRLPRMQFVPPFAWLSAGRVEYALMAFFVTMLFTTPLCRLEERRMRTWVAVFMTLVFVRVSLLPFLSPALTYGHISGIETRIDLDGVCLQNNQYTCGPAAAVTVLRAMGIAAEESAIALEARTNPLTGTPPDSLCGAVEVLYALSGDLEYPVDITDAQGREPFLAVVKHSFLVDHYVAILDVDETGVVIGDPLEGMRKASVKEFEVEWRGAIVVFEK
ncbi:MAG: cysteine peptidase family C39 domain-containing protein [Candidatus Sumerlaeota bacterium]